MSSRTAGEGYWVKLRGWLVWRSRRARRWGMALGGALPTRARELFETEAVNAGAVAFRIGGALVRLPHRSDRVELPPPLDVDGHRFDVLSELADYTTLPPELIATLVRREADDFRSEWHALPVPLREDAWFYTSSRGYLFANAVHVYESPQLVEFLTTLCPEDGCVLEFGGGSGNLAMALAAKGLRVDFLELSALQKDFVRYRVARHGLADRVSILDRWSPPAELQYDLVCAFDVFEHLPDLENVVERQILPSMKLGSALAERSPFTRNLANPMHHEDTVGFESLLERNGLRVVSDDPACRVWRR